MAIFNGKINYFYGNFNSYVKLPEGTIQYQGFPGFFLGIW